VLSSKHAFRQRGGNSRDTNAGSLRFVYNGFEDFAEASVDLSERDLRATISAPIPRPYYDDLAG